MMLIQKDIEREERVCVCVCQKGWAEEGKGPLQGMEQTWRSNALSRSVHTKRRRSPRS